MSLLAVALAVFSLRLSIDIPVNVHLKGEGDSIAVLDKNMAIPAEAGVPMLPEYGTVVALPYGQKAVGVKVIEADYVTYEKGKYVLPTPMPVPTVPPEVMDVKIEPPVENIRIYNSKSYYPHNAVELTSSGHLMGWPVAGLKINPFRYNPSTMTLEELRHIELEIQTVADSVVRPRRFSRITAFYLNRFFKSVLFNPEDVHLIVGDVAFDYVIIVPQDFAMWADSIAALHRSRGFKAVVRTMEWIESHYSGRDRAEKLRNYIKAATDSGLVFVAIAGDEGPMPARVAYAMTSGHGAVGEDSIRADLYFSDLDGTWDADNDGTFGEVEDMVDMYPDVFVGRIPAATAYGLKLYFRKLRRYFEPDSVEYLGRAVLNGMILWDDPFSPGGVAKEVVDSVAVPDSIDVRKLYEYLNTSSYDTAVAELRRGEAVYNHNGHGWYYAMWVAHGQRIHRGELDNLDNPHNYGILYTTGCWVGAFDYYSFGEVFTILENTPGIGFIGNSRYGWGSPGNPGFGYSDVFDTEFFKKLYRDSLTIASMTLAASKIRFIPLSQWKNVYRWHEYEINLLGDPLLVIHRGTPVRPDISFADEIVPSSSFPVFVKYPDNKPAANALVSLSSANGPVATGITGPDGMAVLEIPDSIMFDSLNLVVYGEALVTTRRRIGVVSSFSGPMIILTTVYAVNERGHIPEPGDEIRIQVGVKNAGNAPSGVVSVFLEADSAVSIYEHSQTIGNVQPGEVTACIFHGAVSDTIENFHHVIGRVRIISGTDTSTFPFGFTVGRPHLALVSHAVYSGSDSVISSGEHVRLSLTVANYGVASIHNGRFELVPERSAPVTPISCVVESVSLSPYDSKELMFDFMVGDVSRLAEMGFTLNLTDEAGHEWHHPLSLSLGETYNYESFEEGADGWIFRGHWFITDEESHSGLHSAYCGISGTGYLPEWNDTLISPYFDLPPDPELSFWLKFETANYGVDGIYVYVIQDSSTYLLDFIGSGGALDSTLLIDVGWAEYSYGLSFLNEDRPAKAMFVFQSDGDSLLGRGFYIDDFRVGGSAVRDTNATIGTYHPFPNPALHNANLVFDIPNKGFVTLDVMDVSGRVLKTIPAGFMDRGRHVYKLELDELPEGVFFVTIRNSGKLVATLKLVHMK